MVNDLGVDPDEWFRESIPMSEDPPYSDNFKSGLPDGGPNFSWEDTAPSEYEPPNDNRYAPPEKRAYLDSNPRPEEEVADWFAENPDESDEIEKEKTMHHKMYKIATARYNPFSIGGSENCDSDISCNIGGSENIQNS